MDRIYWKEKNHFLYLLDTLLFDQIKQAMKNLNHHTNLSPKISSQIYINSCSNTKQRLFNLTMDLDDAIEGWLDDPNPSPSYKTKPKSPANSRIGWITKTNISSLHNFRLSACSNYKNKVDIKSIIFPLQSEDYQQSILSTRKSIKISKEAQKILSLVNIRNSQKNSRKSFLETNIRQVKPFSVKKCDKSRIQSCAVNAKLAALKQIIMNRQKGQK